MKGSVRLIVREGPRKENRFAFEEHDTFLVGRALDCHLRLPKTEKSVSRRHYLLEIVPPDARLRDLGSFNGTTVNNLRYGGRPEIPLRPGVKQSPTIEVDLKNGDIIRAGATIVEVEIDGEGSRLRPPPRLCEMCRKQPPEKSRTGPGGAYYCAGCLRAVESDPLSTVLGAEEEKKPPRPVSRKTRKRRRESTKQLLKPKEPTPRELQGHEIVQLIGRGEMGAVYLSRRESDGEGIAVKVMFARTPVEEETREIVRREMEPLIDLRHDNIVPYHELGSRDSTFYFFTAYCPCGNVRDLMKQQGGNIPLDVAAPLMLQALDGLAFAHEKGVVHGNLKPENILLMDRPAGPAQISDFGFARSFEKVGYWGMTCTRDFRGNRDFIPPEQITHVRTVGPSSDVWAMAATFYAMLTGHPPRDSNPQQDPIDMVLRNPVISITTHESGIPQAVADVLHHAMDEKPEERYPTAAEFRQDLATALKGTEGTS